MPLLARPDGIELHWESVGTGPPVVIAPYFMGNPGSLRPFVAELSRDHEVIRFDGRGTGDSTRSGPHDMETGAADLEAVIEEACSSPAVVIGVADSCNRAVRVAHSRPDLVSVIVSPGAAPLPRSALQGVDAMAGSDTVVNALLDTLENYYVSGLRTLLADANRQMTEDELRVRVEEQLDYLPQDVAITRLRTWLSDDPHQQARELGSRLIVLASPGAMNPWWPPTEDVRRLIAEHLPEARVEEVDDGLVSAPGQAAAIVRSITVAGFPAAEQT